MTAPRGSPGITRVLTGVVFVDGGAASENTGSLANPFLTIQAAIDWISVPNTVEQSAQDWTILIAPGDYDETLEINGPVRLALIGLSGFRLGRYTVAGDKQSNIVAVAGSTPRNVVWTYNSDQLIPGGAAPQLVIGTIAGTDIIRPGKPIANRISGSIIIQGGGWTQENVPSGGTAFLAVANTQVDAGITQDPAATRRETTPTQPAIDTIGLFRPSRLSSFRPYDAFTAILVDRHFHSRFRGAIRGRLNPSSGPPAYVLAASFMSQYEQVVEVSQYSSISQGAFASGMSVGQAPTLGMLRSVVPPGIVNSTISGTFTGPAGSLLLDAATNTWFIRNGGVVANAGTKAFLGGASQTLRVSTDELPVITEPPPPTRVKELVVADCGVTVLGDASSGEFSVRLPMAVDDLTFTLKNVGSANSISVVPKPGEPIDGASSVSLVPPGTGARSGIKIVAQDARWWIVGHV